MKLAKLFLLLPAFAMVACSSDKPSSQPVDPTVISEAEFTAIFQDLKLFKEDNFSLKTEVTTRDYVAWTKVDAGKVKIYEQEDVEDPEDALYIEFLENNEIDRIRYEDGAWQRNDITPDKAKEYLFQNSAFLPFEYKDLVRDEENKQYTISLVEMDNYDDETLYISDVTLAFNNNKPTKITFDFSFDEQGQDKNSMELTFTYGGVTVVIPE